MSAIKSVALQPRFCLAFYGASHLNELTPTYMMTLPICRFALLLAATLLCGCVTGEKMSQLHTGMAKAEVVQVLGRPDGDKQVGEFEVYRYSNRLDRGAVDFKRAGTSGWSWDKADYYNVVFKNDRVVEYGTGQVRQQSNGTVVIVPL